MPLKTYIYTVFMNISSGINAAISQF